jgi:undecaprenyl-diphosphatase
MVFSQINEFILAVLLGVIQGVSEFLPISSTAHLRLVTALLFQGKDIGLTASNVIQFGTLVAILQYFRKDLKEYYLRIKQILTNLKARAEFVTNFNSWWNAFNTENRVKSHQIQENIDPQITNKTDLVLAQLITGSLPIILLGALLKGLAETNRGLDRIGWFLLAGSALMYLAERIYSIAVTKQKPKIMSPGEVILIGLFQSLAAFPGISRSGATISGALMLGRNRAESVRFSFLLSIPALGLLGIMDLIKVLLEIRNNGLTLLPTIGGWSDPAIINLSIVSLLISFVFAYLFGLVVLKLLLKYLSTNTFKYFIYYRVVLALVLFAVVLFQLIPSVPNILP